MSKKLRTLLIVSTEPAPYKIDMYNALSDLGGWNVFVFYAATKDWSIDAGHDFQVFPRSRFRYRKNKGKGLFGQVISAVKVMFLILWDHPSLIVVCGYNGLPYVISMIVAYFVKVPFFMWVDQFNVSEPRKKGAFVLFVRNALRNFVFRKSAAILVGGMPGLNSAVRSGCPMNKVVDFPYVVDKKRIESLTKSTHGLHGLTLPDAMRPIILFSGRLIQRKGLQTLLRAIAKIRNEVGEFLLIVEGDGPLRYQYEVMVRDLELNTNVLFVGFCQMDEHAYLLSKSDIIVVPSLRDPWGIVVHEAMLMGKAVCASNVVGSALDRIENGQNGILFRAADVDHLAVCMKSLLKEKIFRMRLALAAEQTAEVYTIERNAMNLMKAYSNVSQGK